MKQTTETRCELRSTSGRDEFALEWLGSTDDGDALVSVEVGGRFWDRGGIDYQSSQVVADFRLDLPQVRVSTLALESLALWLSKRRQNPEYRDFELTAKEGDQKVCIGFSDVDGFICSPSKPAFVFEYSAGGAKVVELLFIVDDTGIDAFQHQLAAALG